MKQTGTMRKVFKFHIQTFKDDNDFFLVWIYLGHMVIAGVIPLIAVILPRYIIDAISISNINQTIMYILIYGVITLVLQNVRIKLAFIFEGHILASRLKRSKMYNEKFRHAEFKHLESKDFHKRRQEAFECMSGNFTGYQGTLWIIFYQLAEIFSIIGFIFILGIVNPWIILVSLVCAVIQFLIATKAREYSIKRHEEYTERERLAQYYYKLAHDFSFGKDIRVNDLGDSLSKRYKTKIGLVYKILKKIEMHLYKYNLFDVLFLIITNGITYLLVVKAYFNGQLSLGTISMTIMTVTMITVKLQFTFRELAKIPELTIKTQKYIDFFGDDYYFEDQTEEGLQLRKLKVEFRNVSFKYPGTENYVLKDVSFTLDPGQKMALVGINGSGKSTIVKLLSGLYKPDKGQIIVNGVNLNDLRVRDYRNHVAVVFQEVNLYAASVLENLTGENPTEEDRYRALEALKRVGLYDKVMNYNNQENQQMLKVIDPNGTDLSGGEAQKLAIARALYKQNTRLIILDEPTASLDAIAEKEIYEHFNELVNGRSAVMISHRLASTKFCDFIIFLENGEIIEKGSHEELMNKENGKYKEMFETQGKYYKEEEGQINVNQTEYA